MPKRATVPFPCECRPELDISPEPDSHDTSHIQSLVEILQWIVKLGHVDIAYEASIMASFMALPRQRRVMIDDEMF